MRTRVAVLACTALLAGLLPATGAAAEDAVPPPGTGPEAIVVPPAAPQAEADAHLAPLVPTADDALTAALTAGDITAGRYALERARSLFIPGAVERRYGELAAPGPREATWVLRDLALRDQRLAPAARAHARGLLARPTDGSADPQLNGYRTPRTATFCTDQLCTHWVRATSDAPPLTDADGDTVPDWVETTTTVLARVWQVVVDDYGYRPPRSDGQSANNGGDGRLDVYLADTGADGLYGYCSTDDPAGRFRRDVSAFCVLDDDFASSQFGAAPLRSLRVTAAHELFHAVQFAYDVSEDVWLMEGTAAWMEDEIYDAANDNYQYLRGGPLARPHVPLDAGVYGPWVFFRFMAEYFGTAAADRPVLIRRIWQRADAAPGAPDDYSLRAVARVSASHGVPFRTLFGDFGWTGVSPSVAYEEGRRYPRAPSSRRITLTASAPSTGARAVTVDHLASRHVTVRPGRGLSARRRLRVSVDLPRRFRGSRATASVHGRDGRVRPFAVPLDTGGDGRRTVPFSRRGVARVVLTLTNASTRMACGRGTPLACGGLPRDDGLRFAYSARAVR